MTAGVPDATLWDFFFHIVRLKILPSTDFGKIRELVTFIWQVTILLSVFISGSLFHNHLIITISYVSSPEYLLRSGRSGNTHVNKTTPLLALQGLTVLRTQEMILQAKHSDPKRCQESQVGSEPLRESHCLVWRAAASNSLLDPTGSTDDCCCRRRTIGVQFSNC